MHQNMTADKDIIINICYIRGRPFDLQAGKWGGGGAEGAGMFLKKNPGFGHARKN